MGAGASTQSKVAPAGMSEKDAKSKVPTNNVPVPERLDTHTAAELPTHPEGVPFLRMVVPAAVLERLRGDGANGVEAVGLDDSPNGDFEVVDLSAKDPETLREVVADIARAMAQQEKEKAEERARRRAEEERLNQEEIERKARLQEGADERDRRAVADKKRKKKAKRVPLPKAEFPASSRVTVAPDADKGRDDALALEFEWAMEPTAFGEWHDSDGGNWATHSTGVREARGSAVSVALEYRRGMKEEWRRAECDADGRHTLNLPAPERPEDGRAWQSRWVVDGRRYLSPLQLAPTLVHTMEREPVAALALSKLPREKRRIENIENKDLRDALLAVENIVPMNTWDVELDVDMQPGAVIGGRHALSYLNETRLHKQQLRNDPRVVSEVRRYLVKTPINLVLSLLQAVRIPAKKLVPNLDYFVPRWAEPDLAELARIEGNPLEAEELRREMQRELNFAHPEWMSGIRVVLPPVEALATALRCRRPRVRDGHLTPVRFTHRFKRARDRKQPSGAPREVKVVWWGRTAAEVEEEEERKRVERDDPVKAAELPRVEKHRADEAKHPPAKAGEVTLELDKTGSFTGVARLPNGCYRYKWVIDGKPYLAGARPIERDDGQTYNTFTVRAEVVFGLGIPV